MVLPRWLWLPALLQTLLAALLCFVPLFDILGYEFCLASGLLCAITAPVIGQGAAKHSATAATPAVLSTLVRAAVLALLHLLPGLLLISLNASRVRNCNYATGLLFFALLPCCTAVYGSSLGVFVARVFERERPLLRHLCLAATVVLPLLLSLWRLYWEPAIFVYNHLWGYFAGSLYDESITIDSRLAYFRLGTLLRVLAICLSCLFWENRQRFGAVRAQFVVVALLGLALLYDVQFGPSLGFRVGRDAILRALPVTVTRPNLVIHLPPGIDPARQNAIGDDHQFRLEELLRHLDVRLTQPIHSYMYASADQKALLMGGRGTNITKPWLHEIHVHGTEAPHPIVPHELAHAVAAEFGSSLLRVSARYELLVNMGLVEGFAQAFTPDADELDLHHWARAMDVLHLNPDMRAILGPAGFWSQAPRRAYTVAGSFVRYLLDTYGAAPLKAAYPAGDFEGAYHKALPELVAEWEHFLSGITVAPREQHIAAERFRTPSIFARPCAHEIAELTAQADQVDPVTAVLIRKQICTHLGNAPAARLELAQAERRAGDLDGFLALSRELLSSKELNAVQQADLLQTQSQVLWQQHHLPEAQAAARAVLELQISLAAERLAWVHLWAMDLKPDIGAQMLQFLSQRLPPVAAVLLLDRESGAHPGDQTYAYLIGRQLLNAGSYEQALTYLRAASPHPFAPIEAERLRLVGDCLWRLGKIDGAVTAMTAYRDKALTSGEVSQANDLLTRLGWLQGLKAH